MKYKIPDDLLKEMQKYASGELVYIPKKEERSEWGTGTGAKAYYAARNEEIRWKYHHDQIKIPELANDYSLSVESIKRILHK